MPLVHNFERGLDLVLDPTGATPLANHIFVSKSGDDGIGTGTPLNPYLTLAAARAANGVKTYVVGTGEYLDAGMALTSCTVLGDGLVVFKGNGANFFTTSSGQNMTLDNLILRDYLAVQTVTGNGGKSTNCTYVNTLIKANANSTADNTYINCTFTLTIGISFNRCIFANSSSVLTGVNNITITNCDFDASSVIDMSGNTGASRVFRYNNNRGTLIGSPTLSVSNFSADPLYVGIIADNEVLVDTLSPNLSSGEGGQNVGNARFGETLNEASTSFGVSPAANTNTTFIGGDLVLTNPILDGSRTSAIIDLGKLYTSPRIKLAGFTDFLNNVASTSNLLSNPNHLTVNIRYAGSNQVYTAYKPFKIDNTGVRILLDAGGKSTGEDGFKWATATTQKLRYIQIQVVVTNNYIVS